MTGAGLLAVTAAALALLGPGPAVHAAPGDGGVVVTPVDPGDVTSPPTIGVHVSTPPKAGGTGRAAPAASPVRPACTYVPEKALEPSMRAIGFGAPPPRAHLYSISCGGISAGFVWLTPAENRPTASPAQLAAQAYQELALPAPAIRTSPAPGVDQLVRVPTWLWIDRRMWTPRSVTASVPGLAATVTARPAEVRWSTGDGAMLTCAGPGTAYEPGHADPAGPSPSCGHTYLRPGRVRVTATVAWLVTWTGGGTNGSLPGLASRGAVPLRVVEAAAINR